MNQLEMNLNQTWGKKDREKKRKEKRKGKEKGKEIKQEFNKWKK